MALYASIGILSGAVLAYELLLLRLLSIANWHHFAFMVISLALLGFGASGTLLTLAGERLVRRFPVAYAGAAALFALTSVGGFALAQRLPFNPAELVWDARQLGALAAMYLVLAIPFLFAGTAIALALARFPERIPRLYGADLMGAGSGAAVALALLHALAPSTCLRLVGAAGLAAAALAVASGPRARGTAPLAAALAALGLVSAFAWPEAWIAPRLSPYKSLSRALLAPGAEVLAERSSPLGWLAVVRSPEVRFRHAPGLSLAFAGELPEQLAVFTDGDALRALSRFDGGVDSLAFLGQTSAALPYRLLERPRVLLLGAGAGSRVLAALHHGAPEVDAVEVDRRLVEVVEAAFGDWSGRPYSRPGVRLHIVDPRAFAAAAGGRWDLVEIDLAEAQGASAGELQPLSENHLLTVEALSAYYDRVAPGGLLAIHGWVEVPPRSSLKLFAAAVEALRRRGIPPAPRLAWIRSWSTTTLLVKQGELSATEIARVRAFCEELSFDAAHLPGLSVEEANRFNQLAEPYFFQAAAALLAPPAERRRFARAYKFDVAPPTDERPYLTRSFRWRSLPELLELRTRGGAAFLQWGYLLLVATLLQAAAAGALLILLPLLPLRRRAGREPAARPGLYFLCLGLAFLMVEVTLIARLTPVLGHPVLAAGTVLGGFLVFAGLGSGAARRLAAGRGFAPRLRLGPAGLAALAAAALVAVYTLLLPHLPSLARLPLAARGALAAAFLAPLAFAMGMPFPLALHELGRRRPAWLPWAWGVNGCASVASPVLATLLAVHFGFSAVTATAAVLYIAAALCARGGRGIG